ncbi:hypothetical protein [Arthrobacter sp. UM1]|uniref:hypothetical protein n=1 Tax=Arthrobacter sp. UM1 TaxID=2766776 RepID=UPI001CF6B0AF|nr:hypothetical protein [Arthrobacter sp. UM1]MCB4207769.1 hypothetical protein [Arthrobacter sp. UM1]
MPVQPLRQAPPSVAALLGLTGLEALGLLGAGVFTVARYGGGGAGTDILLLLLGAVAALVTWGMSRASLAAHKGMVFLQTLCLIAGFSFLAALPVAGIPLIAVSALCLIAGFWPATRLWFERHGASSGSAA